MCSCLSGHLRKWHCSWGNTLSLRGAQEYVERGKQGNIVSLELLKLA